MLQKTIWLSFTLLLLLATGSKVAFSAPALTVTESDTIPLGWQISWQSMSNASMYQVIYSEASDLDETSLNSTSLPRGWKAAAVWFSQGANSVNIVLPTDTTYYIAVLEQDPQTKVVTLNSKGSLPKKKYTYLVPVNNGNLGGIAGADRLCMNNIPEAAKKILPSNISVKAFLIDGAQGQTSRSATSNRDWVLAPNTQYLIWKDNSFVNLRSTQPNSPLFVENEKSALSEPTYVFTGMSQSWGKSSPCLNWGALGDVARANGGNYGDISQEDNRFWAGSSLANCIAPQNKMNILCVQQ